jgi:hypothetical protein
MSQLGAYSIETIACDNQQFVDIIGLKRILIGIPGVTSRKFTVRELAKIHNF